MLNVRAHLVKIKSEENTSKIYQLNEYILRKKTVRQKNALGGKGENQTTCDKANVCMKGLWCVLVIKG